MYLPHQKVKATQAHNGLTYVLAKYLLIKHTNFITISGIDRDVMGLWDKNKCNFTNSNELHIEEEM